MPADSSTDRVKSHPSSSCRSLPIAYIDTPEENTVIAAKEIALSPRVFSSKRIFRYSGTDRARDP
jgi:hypothetical protein